MKSYGSTIKWSARYAGIVFAVLLLAHAINEGVQKGAIENLGMWNFLVIFSFAFIWIGYAIGWLSEKWGALLILGGWVLVYAIEILAMGTFPRDFFIASLSVPGILYLIHVINQNKYRDTQ